MSVWSRLRHTLRPGSYAGEVEEELQYHLAMKEQDGFDTRSARLRFGNPARLKEETRAAGIFVWLESFLRDARYGLRQLGRRRMLSAVVIVSLALGIGANTAIFSLVDAALLKRLPVTDPQNLRAIWWKNHGWPEGLCSMMSGDSEGIFTANLSGSSVSLNAYRQLAAEPGGFSALVGFSDAEMAAVSSGKRAAEQFRLQYASANFFSALGVKLQLGRSFSKGRSEAPVVVVSDRFWRKWFNARGDVLGQVLRVNNAPVQIIGVAPAHFFGIEIGEWVDIYAPLSAQIALSPRARLDSSLGESDGFWWVRMLGRLAPQVAETQAAAQLSARFQHILAPSARKMDQIPQLITRPGERGLSAVPRERARALWILLLLVGLILLIVCANVANLLLARAVARQRESAVCLALGAARMRLLRQYLIESMLLALAGGVAGLLLSPVLANTIHSFIRSDLAIGGFDLRIDTRILLFTAAISLLTALLFGAAPAVRLTRASINDALKAGSRMLVAGHLRLPRALVALEIALSFAVLVAAGLLARSLANLETADIGFDRQNLLYVSVNPWSAGYNADRVRQYADRLRERLASLPGVSHAAILETRPLSGSGNATLVNIPGRPFRSEDYAVINHLSDGALETLHIPLRAGRAFQASDMQPGSSAVIVDDEFARKYFPHRNPIGQLFGTGPKPTQQYRIVGVVGNSRFRSLRDAPSPTMYRPWSTIAYPTFQVNVALRAAVPKTQLARAIRQAAAAIDASVPVSDIQTQSALVDHLLLNERLLRILSSAFGFLALLLCAIGIAGLLAYTVARRTNEIGVRIALGASRNEVVKLILRESLSLVLAGLVIGIPGAFLIGRLLGHTLFRLSAADPASLSASLLLLIAAAGFAAWLPARRAARIDPMSALREE